MPRAIRILYVHNSADLYGASRSLLRLLPRIRERGFEPLALLPEIGPLKDRLESEGVSVLVDARLPVIDRVTFRSPSRLASRVLHFPGFVLWLNRWIKSQGVQLVHTNTGVMPAPALAAKLAGVSHVWHIRDSFEEFRSLWSLYRRFITKLSARVICVSNPIVGQFAGAPRVEVIHNGMPTEEFPGDAGPMRREFRSRHGLDDSALVVGCVGRIKFVRKGQEVLVRALALVKERGLRAKGLIVGSTSKGNEDHLARLRTLIERLGLGDDVFLAGELADPKPAYAAMDVFVLPSAQPEPFGGVVLEAMAMRLPVIATAIGGSLDQVEDGVTGWLVPPGDPERLADKLAGLLRDESLRRRMGEAGRARLEERFSVAQMVDRIERVYRSVLNPSRS